jgi:hypothetical protein
MPPDKTTQEPTSNIISFRDAKGRMGGPTPSDPIASQRQVRARLTRMEKQNAELAEEVQRLNKTINKLLSWLKDRVG